MTIRLELKTDESDLSVARSDTFDRKPNATLSCPRFVAVGSQLECQVAAYSGTNMQLQMTYSNSTLPKMAKFGI